MRIKANKRLFYVLGAILLSFSVLYALDAVLRILHVFFLSALFSVTLAPFCSLIEKRGLQPGAAALICVSFLLAILLLFASVFLPYLFAHIVRFLQGIAPLLRSIFAAFEAFLERHGIEPESISSFTQQITGLITRGTAGAARSSLAIAQSGGTFLVALVISCYVLRERRKFANYTLLLIPLKGRTCFLSAVVSSKNALMSYLSGLLKTSAFVGASTFFALTLLEIPQALLLSLFMAIFEAFPYVGPFIAAIPILLTALQQGITKALLSMLMIIAVQQIAENVIGPQITFSTTSVHPLASLVSALVCGMLFGLPGILFAMPAYVVMRSAYWSLQKRRLS